MAGQLTKLFDIPSIFLYILAITNTKRLVEQRILIFQLKTDIAYNSSIYDEYKKNKNSLSRSVCTDSFIGKSVTILRCYRY